MLINEQMLTIILKLIKIKNNNAYKNCTIEQEKEHKN